MTCNNHKPRANKYGVVWCCNCGALFTKESDRFINKNFTLNEEWYKMKEYERN